MITVSGVSKAFGPEPLFRDVTMTLSHGRRIALVGSNGAGKTTLLEIVVGVSEPDTGVVHRPKDQRVGYLPQELTEVHHGSVLDAVLDGATEVRDLEHQLRELADLLASTSGAQNDAALQAYGTAQARFEMIGGYGVDSEARRILAGLGFAPDDADRPLREMSGGWRMRAALAQLLLSEPEVLVLDEPTNHLDTDSVAWLEDTLSNYPGALLFVSHDRDFIDAVAERVVEISYGTATEFVGGFAEFVVEREERLARLEAAREQQQKQVAQVEKFIERFRYKATKARQVQSRIKTLEKLDLIEVPTSAELVKRFAFPESPRSSRTVAEFSEVSVGYDGIPILTDISFHIERGQKVGIVGPNGGGKTTLLKMLLGHLDPIAGLATLGTNVTVASFAQHQVDQLDFRRTPVQEIQSIVSPNEKRNIRSILGSFGFSGEAAERLVGDLSGGERTRLALCKAFLHPVNLLVLDEPTNHLDLQSCDLLEDALRVYPGTVLLVSHDRYLIREVCDCLVAVRDGRASFHDGVDEAILSPHGKLSKAAAHDEKRTPAVMAPSAKRVVADKRSASNASNKDLKRRIVRLERELGTAETQVADLQRQLGDPLLYDDHARVTAVTRRYNEAKGRAHKLTDEWVGASDELERLGK